MASKLLENHPIEGHCLCGAVTVRGTPVRRHVEACHCEMCRRWNGIAFLGTQFGTDFALSGEEHVVRYRSSDWAERGFCGRCGSSLFYHYIPNGNHAFTAGLFPDDAFLPLSEEIFIDEKPAYYAFEADSEKLTGPEVMAKFGVGQESTEPSDEK
ncbi:MAG: GFA family protein [Porphyrobacter sp.]|nr:GFA family protein [Porphyrobacter sp.]